MIPILPPRARKTIPISLRLDPRTKFALEFVARLRSQSLTTVVHRAIEAQVAADPELEAQVKKALGE